MVTIYDVAKRAGVSHTTVSRVLNRKKTGIPVSEETRKKVLEAAEALNYVPSRAARNLSTGQTNCYCFLLCDRLFTNLFYYAQLKCIEAELAKKGLGLIFAIYKEDEPLPPLLKERAVDGIFVTGRVTREIVGKIKKLKVPFIVLGTMADNDYEANQVKSDVTNDIMTLYNYLLDHGHTEIAYVSDFKEELLIQEVNAGCRLAYQHRGLAPRLNLIKTAIKDPYITMKEMLAQYPQITAFIVQNQFVGAFTSIMREQDIHVPDELSVVVYGDELLDDWQKKHFTCMSSGMRIMCKEAVKNLVELWKEKQQERIDITIQNKIEEGKTVKHLEPELLKEISST